MEYLVKSNSSSKNFAKTVWKRSDWGGETWKQVVGRAVWNPLILIGLLSSGDVTWQVKSPSHQNGLKFQVVFSNRSYTKRAIS
jgi:hypothetical protein